MGLFLTGERQVGKSTALRKALRLSSLRCGGVMTRFDVRHGERKLYLLPYSAAEELPEGMELPEENVCARMGGNGRRAFPAVFDTVGVALLRQAMDDPETDVVVLDELGFLEAEAAEFHAAVLEALSGKKPVLGIVRQGLGAWAEAPLGEMIQVTAVNRDTVPGELLRLLKTDNA